MLQYCIKARINYMYIEICKQYPLNVLQVVFIQCTSTKPLYCYNVMTLYIYLVFDGNCSEVWGGEGVHEEVSTPVPHLTTHTTLHHKPTEGGINDGVKRQKVNYLDLPFTVFSEHFQSEWTCLSVYAYTV